MRLPHRSASLVHWYRRAVGGRGARSLCHRAKVELRRMRRAMRRRPSGQLVWRIREGRVRPMEWAIAPLRDRIRETRVP